jgi:hypothetical protein
MKLRVSHLDGEVTDRGVEVVDWELRVGDLGTLDSLWVMLSTSAKGNKAPVKLGGRRERSRGRCGTSASVGNVEDLDQVVPGHRAEVVVVVLGNEGHDRLLEAVRRGHPGGDQPAVGR